MPIGYEVVEGALRINALNWAIEPSIENSEACMAIVIDKLLEAKGVEKIIIAETRESEYDYEQVKLLLEIGNAYNKLLNEDKILSISNLGPPEAEKMFPKRLSDLQFLLLEVLRKDPIGAYVKLQRMIIHEKSSAEKNPQYQNWFTHYIDNALNPIEKVLSGCKLIQIAKPSLPNFRFGDRKMKLLSLRCKML